MLGIGSKAKHLSSENGSSPPSKSESTARSGLCGGGIRVSRVRRCLCEGGGGGGLRWADCVGLSLRGRVTGPVVVEMREMGLFLENALMRDMVRVGRAAGMGRWGRYIWASVRPLAAP